MRSSQVRKRTTPKPAADTVAVTRGRALKKTIHVARAKAGITSDIQLALRASVSYDTLMNWYGGRTRPKGRVLQRVADTLGVPYASLEAAYEGREPEPQPLQDAVRDLTGAVRQLVAEIRDDRERGKDAAEAFLRAAEALRPRPKRAAGGASKVRPAPRGKAG